VAAARFGLMGAAPERPGDDVSGLDSPLRELEDKKTGERGRWRGASMHPTSDFHMKCVVNSTQSIPALNN